MNGNWFGDVPQFADEGSAGCFVFSENGLKEGLRW